MISILTWVIFGLIVGLVARFLTPGPDPKGFFVTVLIGIAGSFVGGFLSMLMRGRPLGAFDLHPSGFIMSVIGAVVLLLVYRLATKR